MDTTNIDDATKALDKVIAQLWNQKFNGSQVQQLSTFITNMQEEIKQLRDDYNNLDSFVISIYYDLDRYKRKFAELRMQSLTTVESVNEYLSVYQLCHYIPSHPVASTVRTWCCQNKIPHHKMNGKLVFLKNEIDEWLKNKL